MAGFRPKSLLSSSVKIAFFNRFFGAFNQFTKQPTTFLFFFSIPRRFSVVKTRKITQKFFGKKLKKGPSFFFTILTKKIFLNFRDISIKIYQRILKTIKTLPAAP